ncbi:MAG: transglutaminase family protein [Ruminococcus sp.]
MNGTNGFQVVDFHVDSTITISTKYGTRSLRIPLLLLLAIVGCMCTLSVCISMVQPDFYAFPFWTASVLATLSTCFLSLLPNQLHWLGYFPLLAGGWLAFWQREQILLGAKYFYNAYYCAVHYTDTQFFELNAPELEKNAVTWFLCCSSVLLCSLISRSVIRKPRFLLYFLLTFVPIEFGLYEGLEMKLLPMLTVVVTWFGVLALQLAERRASSQNVRSVRYSNAAHCGIAAIAITTAAVLISVWIASLLHLTTEPGIQEKRHHLRQDLENMQWEDIPGSLSKLGITLGILEDPDTRELGMKSSLQYQEKDVANVTLSALPNHGIYLKNYTGSVYEDNQWDVISEETWEQQEMLQTLFQKYECVPQILPFMSNQGLYTSNENATITIEPLKNTELVLQPYASYFLNGSYQNDTGCVTKQESSYTFLLSKMQDFYRISELSLNEYDLPASGFNFSDSTTVDFFQQIGADITQDMFRITTLHPPYLDDSAYTTQALQAALAENFAYRSFVHETYADAPVTDALSEVYASLPDSLLEAAQSGDDWEILQGIRSYLAEQSEYTLSPGKTPSTRDFVNYFLLENHAGYCVHYATAGTILARYFGIPARYCEGYVLSLEMMENGEKNADGSVTITIPDSAGHAWCELYVDGYGWVPFEMTPGYYETESVSTPEEVPATNTTPVEEPVTESQTQTEIVTQTTTTTIQATSDIGIETQSHIGSGSSQITQTSFGILRILKQIAIVVLCIIVIMGIVFLLHQFKRNQRRRAFDNPDTIAAIQCIYMYLMRLLQQISIVPENQQMLDFAEKTEQMLNHSHYDGAGAARILHLALAADMGGKPPTQAQIQESVCYVQNLANQIAKNKRPIARWMMKYWNHLL